MIRAMKIPSTIANNLRGIDISHYQGHVDWKRCFRESGPGTADNIVSIAIKAQEGDISTPDDCWEKNWKGSKDAGFEFRDAYLFHRPSADPFKSADLFSNLILKAGGLYTGDSISFDFECADAPHTTIVSNALSCLGRIEENLGYEMFVYTANWYARDLIPQGCPLSNRKLWVAHYGVSDPTLPPTWKEWFWWQYGADGYGSVAGIPVGDHVDHDVFRSGSIDDLRQVLRSMRIRPIETIPRADAADGQLTESLIGRSDS